MVRVFLKGGIWKNSEDEVLKAAVQKYGKNQWARVASLLNRKSAKQAKARWYEWLDPSIRKTEWSRAEEEKLLHLAKLLPAQWKTIAPMVGRTASQCQEHYEYMLDQAVSGEGGEDAKQSAVAATTGGLRPGQIDSHPETKPARPDPVDMDEDELEMLQEARARLANTQGKKAKRKQREKMLAQAKRLADLQKRRELKQAGLLSKAALKKSKKNKREIDLGVEIPFHKPAPVGFHDTSSEEARTESIREKRLTQVDFQKVNESRYRQRDYDEAQRQKKEEKRMRMLERENEKYKQQKKDLNEDSKIPSRPRGLLKLPEPTMTDTELAQMAKLQQQQQSGIDGIGGSSVTQALLGDYSDRPLPTPMRTPAAGAGQQQHNQRDLIREASQLRALERGQTPLLGGQLQQEEELDDDDDEELGQGDAKLAAAATPLPPDRAGSGRTPGGSSAMAPPAPRDHLQLNRTSAGDASSVAGGGFNDASSVGASTFASSKYSIRELARQERKAAKRARQQLEEALAALPAPQFEYELAAPADEDMDDEDAMKVETVDEEDQADIEAAERERLRKKAAKLYEARSSVLKRKDLPRPVKVLPSSVLVGDTTENDAQSLIRKEFLTLLQHDAHAHPVATQAGDDPIENGKKKKKRKLEGPTTLLMEEIPPEVPLDYIPEARIRAAKDEIAAECEALVNAKIAALLESKKADSHDTALALLADECSKSSRQGAEGIAYVQNEWIACPEKSNRETLLSLKLEFDTLKAAADALKKKNDKLEAKLGVVNGGYLKRSEQCGEEIFRSFGDLQDAKIEESVYRMLQKQESRGGADRIERLQREVDRLKASEAALQKEYGDLTLEKRRQQLKRKDPGS